MRIRRLPLLLSFLVPLLVFANVGQASAGVHRGTGISVTVLGAQLVPGGVNVNFTVRCGTAQDEKGEVSTDVDTTPDTYILIFNFTLTQGAVTNSGGNNGTYPSITCGDQMAHPFTFNIPSSGYVAGIAQLTNVNAAALDSDNSCGTVVVNGQTYPKPCDGNYPGFSSPVRIR